MGKTELEIQKEKEYEKVKDDIVFVVQNLERIPNGVVVVESSYNDLEDVLHKLKLDMMFLATQTANHHIRVEVRRKGFVRA